MSIASARRVSILAAALAGAECGNAIPPRPIAMYPGPAEAILGTGSLRFVPIADCARVPIIHGPQGGYHIWGSVRLRYMGFDKTRLVFTIADAVSGSPLGDPVKDVITLAPPDPQDPTVGNEMKSQGGLSCPDGGLTIDAGVPPAPDNDGGPTRDAGVPPGWGEVIGLLVFVPLVTVDAGLRPTIDGETITMRVEVTDADGRSASDARSFVPFFDR